eukprot:scaffold2735_cov114-Isochrysis_galbana.AAC.5
MPSSVEKARDMYLCVWGGEGKSARGGGLLAIVWRRCEKGAQATAAGGHGPPQRRVRGGRPGAMRANRLARRGLHKVAGHLKVVVFALQLLKLLRHVCSCRRDTRTFGRIRNHAGPHVIPHSGAQLVGGHIGPVLVLGLLDHPPLDPLWPAALRRLTKQVGDGGGDARRAELLGTVARWDEVEPDEVVGYLFIVLGRQVGDKLEQRELQLRRHLEHHAPVQDAELAVGGTQEITRVRITGRAWVVGPAPTGSRGKPPAGAWAEWSWAERGRQVAPGVGVGGAEWVGVEGHAAEPRHVARVRVSQPLPVHPLRRQHVSGGELIHHPRRCHRVEPARPHRSGEGGRAGSLAPVIQLINEAAAPFVHQSDQVGVQLVDPLPGGSEAPHHVQVERDR